MAVSRALSSFKSCKSCQLHLLSNFASLAGLSLRPPAAVPVYQRANAIASRSFSASRFRSLEATQIGEGKEDHENRIISQENPGEGSEDATEEGQSTTETIPWYLQVQPPVRASSPLSDKQRLPDLPVDPPPLLQPILQHLSIEIGLDDLTLLDVRKLDPPPALGANLLMVIGTARSEKHLHVSADRFSRWLRNTHRLKPYADGLLGRNELKLKLRRKARRAKLLGSVGSSETGNVDDGIRTGWVCVNVGSIEEAEAVPQEEVASQNFVGFGGQSDGVKLVVQMLTEEKREDLDLETLWGGFLARQQRKEAREALKLLEEGEDQEVGHGPQSVPLSVTDTTLSAVRSQPLQTPILPSSTRGFHTSGRQLSRQFPTALSAHGHGSFLDADALGPRVSMSSAGTTPLGASNPEESTPINRSKQKLTLRSLIKYLKSLPKEIGIEILGTGSHDRNSTAFLASFYQRFPVFPDAEQWSMRIQLIGHAVKLGHPGYSKADVADAVKEMQRSSFEIPHVVFQLALQFLAQPASKSESTNTSLPVISNCEVTWLMEMLSDMSLRSIDIFEESTISRLFRALAHMQSVDESQQRSLKRGAIWQLLSLLDKRQLYLNRSSSHYFIMSSLASMEDWEGFWRYWRGIARRMQRKPFILYASMFSTMAKKQRQAECIDALSEWIPEMDLEEPKVPLTGLVARAVKMCLQVAYPDIVYQIRLGKSEVGQWARLWRQCEAGLSAGDQITQEEIDDGLLEHFMATASS